MMDVLDVDAVRDFYLQEHAALQRLPRAVAMLGAPNIVMGLARGLGKAEVEVFVNSLRHTGYKDEIALFVTKIDPELQAFCRQKSVTLVKSTSMLHSIWNGAISRYVQYYDYLMSRLANGHGYSRVFMSDVTDVAFQLDPFSLATPDRLTVCAEGATIAECHANSLWIKLAFGTNMFAKLSGKPIYCSGTTMGPLNDILSYCLKMIVCATRANPVSVDYSGIDQGLHNYLIHEGALPDCHQTANGEIVLTMQHYIRTHGMIFSNAEGQYCDETGRVFPVVHQYNRDTTMHTHMREEFA